MSSEEIGCSGCLLVLLVPLIAFLGAYAAHCGWSHYTP